MPVMREKYNEAFRKNAVKMSYSSTKSVKQVADDLGICEIMLYRWRKAKYTIDADMVPGAALEEEAKGLRLENAEQKMEMERLMKAAAYFRNLFISNLHTDGDPWD